MDHRQKELSAWVAEVLNLPNASLSVVSGDASFRRYFRLTLNERSWVAMDAPPDKEDSSSFVSIAKSWLSQGICVPKIEKYDLEKGFLLLSDMGDGLLLDQLCPENPNIEKATIYYQKAMDTLLDIQALVAIEGYPLPAYDSALLQREMALFRDWLLSEKLGLALTASENDLLDQSFTLLESSALAQRQTTVHRDFHARNLMVLETGELGVIDFQDAVKGPITYDLVSLLRDCYIVWPDEKVDSWCRYFYEHLTGQALIDISHGQFKQDFDWMGLQRHLKAAGIFARLSLRDGKHSYLADIPRTVDYIVHVTEMYPQMSAFHQFLTARVLPLLKGGLGS